jgi:hypothetical protein
VNAELQTFSHSPFTSGLRAAIFMAKLLAVDVDGVVAQLAERLVRNEKVAGSIPVGSTSLRSEPTLGGFKRRMVSSIALAKEDFSP